MKWSLQRFALAAAMGAAALTGSSGAEATARWVPDGDFVPTRKTVEIVCRVEWPDSEGGANVLPVEPPSLDWGRLELVRTVSVLDAGGAHLDQVFALTAAAPGTFQLPAIKIQYIGEEESPLDELPFIEASPLAIEVRETKRALTRAITAAAVTAVLAGVLVALRLRRQRNAVARGAASPGVDVAGARDAFTRAKACRIEGDFYGCYRALSDSASALGAAHSILADELSARAEAAGYGGARPDDSALDSDFRAVQRALRASRAEDGPDADTTVNQHKIGES